MNPMATGRPGLVNRRRLPLLAVAMALGTTGCISGFDSRQPVADVFVLGVAAGVTSGTPLPGSVTVRLPTVRGGWEGTQLPVRLPDGRRTQLAGARWSRPLDEGVAAVVADTLRARGAYSAVLADTSPFAGRWTLELEVAEFTAVYAREGEPPTVQVLLNGVFGRARDRALLGPVTGRGEIEAGADTRTAIAAAFEAALQAAVLEVAAQAEGLAAGDR
jgi:ABC-type uncharacterized transport system auxiliary subunit